MTVVFERGGFMFWPFCVCWLSATGKRGLGIYWRERVLFRQGFKPPKDTG